MLVMYRLLRAVTLVVPAESCDDTVYRNSQQKPNKGRQLRHSLRKK
jgi:hypothetical protein